MKKLYTKTLTLPDGRRKYFRAKTKEELEKRVMKARMELGAGVNIDDDTTFGEFAQLWFDVYKKPHIRKSTQENIKASLNNHALPVLGQMRVKDIKAIHINQFVAELSGLKKGTQAGIIHYVKAIFQAAVDNGLILKTPFTSQVRAQGESAPEKEPLTPEQSEELLLAAWGNPVYLFCLLALSTGMRKGEILGLGWDSVDFRNHCIRVEQNLVFYRDGHSELSDSLKTDASCRVIPMGTRLETVLGDEFKHRQSQLVFCTDDAAAYTPATFSRMWRVVDRVSTLDPGKIGATIPGPKGGLYRLDFHVSPHLLRHTFITRCFEAGLDIKEIQYLAGHSTPEMTLKVYTHYCKKSREADTAKKVREAIMPPVREVV